MAHITSHPTVSLPVLGYISRFFTAIGNGLIRMGENNSRFRQIEALQAMSDAQLAERGIKREDIVRVVFGGHFYI